MRDGAAALLRGVPRRGARQGGRFARRAVGDSDAVARRAEVSASLQLAEQLTQTVPPQLGSRTACPVPARPRSVSRYCKTTG